MDRQPGKRCAVCPETLPCDLGKCFTESNWDIAQQARLAQASIDRRKDTERMDFLDRHCSVTFTFKRADGSTGQLIGPSNIRAAIDAAMCP